MHFAAESADPPGWLANRVARLKPERIHLNSGEPIANRDLAERFQAMTGLLGANEPVHLDAAPDSGDQLAISKIAVRVAVEANRVTPTTFPAVTYTALIGAFYTGLNRAGESLTRS